MTDVLNDDALPPMAGSIIVGKDLELADLALRLRLFAAVGVTEAVTLTLHPAQLLPIARGLEWRNQLDAVRGQIEGAERNVVAARSHLRKSVVTFAFAAVMSGLTVGSAVAAIFGVLAVLEWVLG